MTQFATKLTLEEGAHSSDEDVQLTVSNMWSKLRPEGLLIVSIRDCARIVKERHTYDPPRVFEGPGDKRAVFQLWLLNRLRPSATFTHPVGLRASLRIGNGLTRRNPVDDTFAYHDNRCMSTT